jgi:hypothetical protein
MDPQIANEESRKMALNVLLTEYKELKSEIGGRVQRQSQAFNYFLLSLGVFVSALATVVSKQEYVDQILYTNVEPEGLVRLLGLVIVGLPLLTVPLSLIFFDDELMIWASEIYIQTRLKPHVNRLLQSALSGQCLCRPLLDGTFAWRSLHLRSIFRVDHALYAKARWFLFWVPVATAFVAVGVIIATTYNRTDSLIVPVVLLVLNLGLTYLLMKATLNAITVRRQYCALVRTLADDDKGFFPATESEIALDWSLSGARR